MTNIYSKQDQSTLDITGSLPIFSMELTPLIDFIKAVAKRMALVIMLIINSPVQRKE